MNLVGFVALSGLILTLLFAGLAVVSYFLGRRDAAWLHSQMSPLPLLPRS
jgi:hypothetical protein